MKSKTSKKIALVAFLSALTLSASAVGVVSLEKDTFSPLATVTASANETNVAKIGDATYETLEAAFADVNDGDTITFLEDIANLEVTIKNDVTLDLNGKTITDAYVIVKGEVTIKNGSIVNTNEPYPLVVQNGGKLTVENVAIEASNSDRAISVKSGSSLIFNSGSILATKGANNTKTSLIAAIYTDSNTDVTINGGTITVDTPNNKAVGIYGNYTNANVTVNGGKISTSGKNYCYGINVDGDIAVNGGEIVTNEKGYGYDSGVRYGNNYALVSATGDVTITGGKITTNGFSGYIVSVGRSYSSNDQTVTISGGELTNNLSEVEQTTGGHKAPVLVWEGSASNVTATITDGTVKGFSAELLKGDSTTLEVSGGTFDVAVNEKYWAENFEIVENADGSYTVKEPTKGTITYCYTSASAFWGEGSSNAAESYVVELYEGETKIASASLKDVDNIIDGTYKNLTWNIPFAGSNDPYWTVKWAENYPKYDMNPDTVKLVVDGVEVSKNVVKWSGADDVAKIVALAEGFTGGVVAYTSLADAVGDFNGRKVNVIRDVTESIEAFNGCTLTTNVEGGVTITNTYEGWVNANDFNIGKGVNVVVNDIFYNTDGENSVEGTLQVVDTFYHGYNATTTVQNGGSIKVLGTTILRYNTEADAGLYIYGDGDNTTVEYDCDYYIGAYSGTFYAEDATIETGYFLLKNSYDNSNYANIDMTLDNSTLTVVGTTDTQDSFIIDDQATLTLKNGSNIADVRDFNVLTGTNLTLNVDETSSISATYVNVAEDVPFVAEKNEDGTVSFVKYVAKIGDVGFASVANALTYAQNNGITDLEITLCGETSKENTDAFNLMYQTQFNSVTFKQEDASKVYYLYDIYTGERTNGGEFVFDGVNIVVTHQYMFEGNVRLTNNSVVKSTAAANCFQYYSTTTIEPGSKLYGVIDDFRGGDVIVDGGRTDGAYNETPDMQDAILIINWRGDRLTVQNGAYVNVNAANEVGRVTINAGASLNVDDSKFDAWQWIDNNGTINVDTESAIKTQKVTGAGKITVDATNFSRSVCVIKADFSAFTGTIAITGNNDVTYEIKDDGLYLVEKPKVAKVNGNRYTSLEEAAAAAVSGETITLLADVTLSADLTLPAGITFNGNGFEVSGATIWASGDLTFVGYNKVTMFNAGYNKPTITIGEGATLELTTGRMVIGHGATFNITGSIVDAKTTDKTTVQPSLIAAGASFTGAGVNFNVKNAYVKFTAYCSSKNSNASSTFNFNVTNSIWDQTSSLVFSEPTNGMDPTINFNLKDSVLESTSHLVFAVTKGEIVFDNSVVNEGVNRQLENRSTLTIKNGSVVYAAHATSSNAKNPGTTIVDNATYIATGEFTGSDVGTGTLIVKEGASVTMGSITKANVVVDATNMTAGDVIDLTANLSKLTGTLVVTGNDKLEAKIVEGKIVLAVKPVAQIGETKYATLAEAVAAAQAGETVTLVADVTLKDTLHIVAGKVVTLDLNGYTISQVKEQTAGYQMILNDGKLIINDSVGTGLISYTDSGNGGEYISDTIYNRSVLVINGGTIENISSATVARNGYPHAVDTYSGIRDTSVTINGGVIYCKEYSAIRMFCVSATYEADLVINDGATIKGAIDMQNGTKNSALGSLTINGGTFETTANANNVRFANWNGGATEYGIEAKITGGTFNGGFTTAYVPAAANFNKKFVSGGTFATDISEYCAEGFRAVENTDGTYGVVQKYKFYGANLTIGSDLTVNYFVKLTDEEAAKMVVDFKFEHWTSTIRVSGERYNSAYYVFHFEHVAPQQMGDVIIASLKMMNDSGEYVEVDLKDDYSVKAYAYHELSRTSIEGYSEAKIQALHTLMADMLNYGAAAQLYDNYKVDSLVNAELTVSGSTFTAPTDSDASLSGSNSIQNFSATLVYDHANSIRVYFVPADLNAVSVKVVVGAKITDLAIQKTTDGRYYVQVDDIEATHFADIYYFVFNDSSENEVVISYSVKSYVYNKHNSETDGELIRALWNYGNSAVAYKKTK